MGRHPHRRYEVLESFERFSQVDDVFSRSRWDPEIQSDASDRFYSTYRRPLTDWRAAPGFTQHAARTRPPEVVRSREVLRRLPPVHRCVPGQGDSCWLADR